MTNLHGNVNHLEGRINNQILNSSLSNVEKKTDCQITNIPLKGN